MTPEQLHQIDQARRYAEQDEYVVTRTHIRNLLAIIEGQDVGGWRPAETAPEYTEVMVWPHPTDYCMTAQRGRLPKKAGGYGWYYAEYETGFGVVHNECRPTHWQPLPEPPK